MSVSKSRILYEDQHLLVVSKLGGELVVRGKGKVGKLPLLDFLKQDYPGLRPVHRLDFETSGAVVFARSSGVLQSIIDSGLKGWQKRYIAIVVGSPKPRKGTVDLALIPRSGQGKVPAHTAYEVIEEIGPVALVAATIEHGQFHQIRRHLAMIGHPLVLDDEHGDKSFNRKFTRRFKLRRFFLHAASIKFPHPVTGGIIEIAAPMPDQFERILKEMRKAASGK